jgi:hypothetical protein
MSDTKVCSGFESQGCRPSLEALELSKVKSGVRGGWEGGRNVLISTFQVGRSEGWASQRNMAITKI